MPSGIGGGLGGVTTAVDESTSSTLMTCQPLGPRTPAQVTVAPGLRSSCAAWRSVVTCRNASLLSASRAKNPYPLTALNHLTLPRSSTVPTSPPVSPCWVVISTIPCCYSEILSPKPGCATVLVTNCSDWLDDIGTAIRGASDVSDRSVQGKALPRHRRRHRVGPHHDGEVRRAGRRLRDLRPPRRRAGGDGQGGDGQT